MCSLLNPSLCIHALLITVIDFVFHLGFEITCPIRELCKEAALGAQELRHLEQLICISRQGHTHHKSCVCHKHVTCLSMYVAEKGLQMKVMQTQTLCRWKSGGRNYVSV